MLTTFQNVAHRHGVLNQRRFEPAAGVGNSHYDVKLGYPSSHQFALDAVPAGSRVLDIGAGPGRMASELVQEGLRGHGRRPVPGAGRADATSRSPAGPRRPAVFDAREYDHLLMLDVIEHLQGPRAVPRAARRPVRLRPSHPGAHHAERRVRRAAADAPGRAVQLRQRRDPRPHAHAPVHLPQPAAPAGRLGLQAARGAGGAGAVAQGARRRGARPRGGAGERAADPAEPDAVLLPDLRRRRLHPGRPLRPRRLAVAQRGPACRGDSAGAGRAAGPPADRPADRARGRRRRCGDPGQGRLRRPGGVRLADGRGRRRAAGGRAAEPPGGRGRAAPGAARAAGRRGGGPGVRAGPHAARPAVRRDGDREPTFLLAAAGATVAACVVACGRGWLRYAGVSRCSASTWRSASGRSGCSPRPSRRSTCSSSSATPSLPCSRGEPVLDHLPQPVPRQRPTTAPAWWRTGGCSSGSSTRR